MEDFNLLVVPVNKKNMERLNYSILSLNSLILSKTSPDTLKTQSKIGNLRNVRITGTPKYGQPVGHNNFHENYPESGKLLSIKHN